jgi:hypothetical protein
MSLEGHTVAFKHVLQNATQWWRHQAIPQRECRGVTRYRAGFEYLLPPINATRSTVKQACVFLFFVVLLQLTSSLVMESKSSTSTITKPVIGQGAWRLWGQSSSPGKGKIFLLSTSSTPVPGPTQPPIQWVTGALAPGVKQPGREADHSPPTSAKVQNTWIYTSTLPYVFMA